MTIRNAGDEDVDTYTMCSYASTVPGLTGVQVAELDLNNRELGNEMIQSGVPDASSLPAGAVCTNYALLSPLKKDETRDLVVMTKTTDHVVAYPHERKQLDAPMVLLTVPETYYSMYEIEEEVTQIRLTSEEGVEKVSGGRAIAQDKEEKSIVRMETKENVKPFTAGDMKLHVTLAQPLLRATSVQRDIYVSHWGKIHFRELYDVRNEASAIKGEFSRVDFLLNDQGTIGAALQFQGLMPGGAFDIRYRDEIGNISTSTVARNPANELAPIGLGMEPRFPLFGGWHTKFELSYSISLDWLLRKSEANGLYEMVFTQGPAITEVVFENVVTRIHLPEGSNVVDVPKLGNQRDLQVGSERTFMSVLPRPVVTIKQTNVLVERTLNPSIAEIKYSYQPLLRFDKLVACALASLVAVKLWQGLASIELDGGVIAAKVKTA